MSHIDSFEIQYALKTLHDASLMDDVYQQLIEHSSAPFDLANVLIELDHASLLPLINLNTLSTIPDLYHLSEILYTLNQADMLTEDYFNSIITQTDLMNLAHIVSLLSMFDMLNTSNFNKIIDIEQLNLIAYTMAELNRVQLLNQPNFDAILEPENSAILSTEAIHLIFDHLPQHLIAANWRHILEIISRENPINRLEQFVNLILGFIQHDEEEPLLNMPQSTHTASVHQSVSESALRLMGRYQKNTSENMVKNIISYLKDCPPGHIKNESALRCIAKITSPNYEFVDPVSQVSIQKLLLLCLHAISDEKMRLSNYQDALNLLIEGLYEIQRGYNLDEKGIDKGGEDLSICRAGAFNKLIEKMQGIHPDCQVKYISAELASLKLPIVVHEEVINYLTLFAFPKNTLNLMMFTELLNKLQFDGLEILWNQIKPQVSNRISNEFSSVFPKASTFNEFIENGKYTELVNLTRFQEPISNSKGYKKFCNAAIHQQGLFKLTQTIKIELKDVLRQMASPRLN